MSSPKILVDLFLGHKSFGFSGIPQDTRLLFSGLAMSEKISSSGIVWGGECWLKGPLNSKEQQSVFLGSFLNKNIPPLTFGSGLIGRNYQRISQACDNFKFYLKNRHKLYPLESEEFKEIIWRSFFMATVDPADFAEVMKKQFLLLELGVQRINISSFFEWLPKPSINTTGYDFMLFQDARHVELSKGTTRVIRYHDAIPVFASDTATSEGHIRSHIRSVKRCAEDSIFVCNSTSAQKELIELAPRAERNTHVIPYFVPPMKVERASREKLELVAHRRLSMAAMPGNTKPAEKRAKVAAWFKGTAPTKIPPFLMTLSTIEPRKNIPSLIKAWNKLRETHRDLRLLIVGKPGWQFEASLREMAPYIEEGSLLHLEGLAQEELATLYSAASCFVFPSFREGFGLPPVEAMQCNCPVVVSDIMAHRYMAGDAALFCNPYDSDDIAAKIEQALTEDIANDLRVKGRNNAKRFTVEAVLPLWEELFNSYRGKGIKA